MTKLMGILTAISVSQVAAANTYSFSCKSGDGKILLSDTGLVLLDGAHGTALTEPHLETSLQEGARLIYKGASGLTAQFEVHEMVKKGIVTEKDNGPCPDGLLGYTQGHLTEKFRLRTTWTLGDLPPQTLTLTCVESHTWSDNCSY